jgi:hypothetical protein
VSVSVRAREPVELIAVRARPPGDLVLVAALVREVPPDIQVSPRRGNRDGEHPAITGRQEVRGLTAIELGGLQVVALPMGDLDDLVGIAVQVSERERERAVAVVVPALEEGKDGLARVTQWAVEPGLLRLERRCRPRE